MPAVVSTSLFVMGTWMMQVDFSAYTMQNIFALLSVFLTAIFDLLPITMKRHQYTLK